MLFTFSRPKRLIHNREFQAVFKTAEFRLRTGNILLLAKHNTMATSRLGVVVSKKHLKKAVDRNRFKRTVRESFRKQDTLTPSLDIIVLALKGIHTVSHKELSDALVYLWKKLIDISKTR